MSQSNIEWCQRTWNPTTGCTKISAGCKNCYALRQSLRNKAMRVNGYHNGFELTLHPDKLKDPFKWKQAQLVFVNSMSDLFHEDVPLSFIQAVFKTMNECPQHTFQILTKRADVLARYDAEGVLKWTKNIWMGVSVEDDRVVDRIKFLQQTKAHVKFISFEPLIGPIPKDTDLAGIKWCITGGESGPGATRPIEKQWVMDIRDKCAEHNIAFFHKQWGKKQFNPNPSDPSINKEHAYHAKGGCALDKVVYRQMPKASGPPVPEVIVKKETKEERKKKPGWEKVKKYGEVFTPPEIINQMCDALPKDTWTDPTKTILDPCAGHGNFQNVLVPRLMEGLKDAIPEEKERYKNIMEKQIYMGELQRESARIIDRKFNPDGTLKLNLYVGDFLRMPEDFFDLPWEERILAYPQHYVWNDVAEDAMIYPEQSKKKKPVEVD